MIKRDSLSIKRGWKMNPEVSQHLHENFQGLLGSPLLPRDPALGASFPPPQAQEPTSATRQHRCVGLVLVQLAPRL